MKYTEEQLLAAQPDARLADPEALAAFNELVEHVREYAEMERRRAGDLYIDEHGTERLYTHLNRRRLLRTGNKPVLRKKTEVSVDEDGWATMARPRRASGAEEEERPKKDSKEKRTKAVDPRDNIADKQPTAFNAFDALADDSE